MDLDFEPPLKKGIPEKEFQETLDYINSHPLFMKKLPDNYEDNEIICALVNIFKDDEPEHFANYYNVLKLKKKHGNEILTTKPKNKYWLGEALKSYEEGLKQDMNDPIIKSKLLSNKSIISFHLSFLF